MKTIFEKSKDASSHGLTVERDGLEGVLVWINHRATRLTKPQALGLASAINAECGGPVEGGKLTDRNETLKAAAKIISLNQVNTIGEGWPSDVEFANKILAYCKEAPKPAPVDDYPDGWYEAKIVGGPTNETVIVRKRMGYWHTIGSALPKKFINLIILGSVGELRE